MKIRKFWNALHQYSGKVLSVRDAQKMSGGDTFLNWQMPLHAGSAFGMTGRTSFAFPA